MNSLRGFVALALLIVLAGSFSSCAIHPCAQAPARQSPNDFVFREFKTKAHTYPMAITRPAGAPILVLHGMCGLDGATLDWAKALARHGWKVYLPMLDGEFNQCKPASHYLRIKLSRSWETKNPNATGPVVDDLGTLADAISARHGGKRLVVVGQCLTGSIPLALLSRPSVKTAVLCHPALPLKSPVQVLLGIPQSAEKRKALALPPDQLHKSLNALSNPTKRLYGFQYLEDPLASIDKFVLIHEKLEQRGLGWKFRPVVLVPAGAPHDQTWWTRMNTTLKKGRVTPHVTITGGEEVDRTPLRKLFDRMIRP
jgi:esterase/lipase